MERSERRRNCAGLSGIRLLDILLDGDAETATVDILGRALVGAQDRPASAHRPPHAGQVPGDADATDGDTNCVVSAPLEH